MIFCLQMTSTIERSPIYLWAALKITNKTVGWTDPCQDETHWEMQGQNQERKGIRSFKFDFRQIPLSEPFLSPGKWLLWLLLCYELSRKLSLKYSISKPSLHWKLCWQKNYSYIKHSKLQAPILCIFVLKIHHTFSCMWKGIIWQQFPSAL